MQRAITYAERNISKVERQIRENGPSLGKPVLRNAITLIAICGAIYLCIKIGERNIGNSLGNWMVLAIIALGVCALASFSLLFFTFFEAISVFIPEPDRQERPSREAGRAFTTGGPATFGQLDAAARGDTSGGFNHPIFED